MGRTDARIKNIEHILEVDYKEKFKAIDKRFNQMDERFDKLYNLLLKKQ